MAIEQAIEAHLPSGIYNLGSGYSTSVYDICRIVEEQLSGKESISRKVLDNGQQDETINYWADTRKIENLLEMKYNTSLNEGIKEHIESVHSEYCI